MKTLKRTMCLLICSILLIVNTSASVSAATIVQPSVKWSFPKVYKVNVDITSSLSVRTGPSTSYSIIYSLQSSSNIVCDGQNSSGTWYHISVDDGQYGEGWVSSSYLDPVDY